MASVRDEYENGECPDCAEPIPEDADDGSECDNCGHTFFMCSPECTGCSQVI